MPSVVRRRSTQLQRSENDEDQPSSCGQRVRRKLLEHRIEPRRSGRLAALPKALPKCAEVLGTETGADSRVQKRRTVKSKKNFLEGKKVASKKSTTEVIRGYSEMDSEGKADGYSTDVSVDSLYAVEANTEVEEKKTSYENAVGRDVQSRELVCASNTVSVDSSNLQMATAFGTQIQDLLMRVLIQSTAALVSPPPLNQAMPAYAPALPPAVNVEEGSPQKTWSLRTYNVVKARQSKENHMTRTSAGEGSDSQEDFPIPENETAQERSVRTRRLNRFRVKQARQLTRNRTALKKLPHVIHVDGMGKAKGIHKHLWRAAIRGVCSRLDPTMDNINHHSKQVVDSIFQALEKEWEFEGFVHRAREMFERSATKYMRNRKMQLKYKCQKIADGFKPDDVNKGHWTKIVGETKKMKKATAALVCGQSTSKGKEQVVGGLAGNDEFDTHEQEMNCDTQGGSPSYLDEEDKSSSSEADDVDARIRTLQMELMRLRKSKKSEQQVCVETENGAGSSQRSSFGEGVHGIAVQGGSESMKENLKPSDTNIGEREIKKFVKNKSTVGAPQDPLFVEVHAQKSNTTLQLVPHRDERNSREDLEETEMDCGDVVKVFAFTGGRKEEIGKGIVMGLAGSKYARKVIPKGWHCIKVTTCTPSGASKICPFPARWSEQIKHRTVKEMNGRSILWPDMLLSNLRNV